MRRRHIDVFIEMKHLDTVPIDSWRLGQAFKKVELRSSGCGDNTGTALLFDCFANGIGGIVRSCLS
jgi:hypothetical protein